MLTKAADENKEATRPSWESRRSDFEQYVSDPELTAEGNDELGPLNEYVLSVDEVEPHTFCRCDQESPADDCGDLGGYGRIQISYGGPSEEIRIFRTGRFERRIEFWRLDWFVGAHIDITDDPVAKWVVDYFDATPAAIH